MHDVEDDGIGVMWQVVGRQGSVNEIEVHGGTWVVLLRCLVGLVGAVDG